MKKSCSIVLLVFAMQLSSAAAAQISLQASGKWGVDYRESSCVLSRSFGRNEDDRVLTVTRNLGVPTIEMRFQNIADIDKKSAKITVDFPPSDSQINAGQVRTEIIGDAHIVRFFLHDTILNELGRASSIEIRKDGRNLVQLSVDSGQAALSEFEKCETDLYENWVVDPKNFRITAKNGEPGYIDRLEYFKPNIYPAEAFRLNAHGRVFVLLKIGKDGSVSSCRTIVSSKNAELDAATCSITSRFRYPPFKGASGELETSWTTYPVIWGRP